MPRRLPGLIALIVLVGGIGLAFAEAEFSFGPLPSFTGAPAIADKAAEENCTACHQTYDGTEQLPNLDLPGGGIEILDLPDSYETGVTYPITIRLSSDSTVAFPNRRWGFQLTAVRASDGNGIGTFLVPPGDTLKVVPGGPELGFREYIEHRIDGVRQGLGGPVTWTFGWKAPDQHMGDIRFYGAGNAANGSNSPEGDFIYTTSDSIADIPTPVAHTSWGRFKMRYR